MRHRIEQLALLGQQAFDIRRHGIEHLGQRADVRAWRDQRTLRQVAFAQALRRGLEPLQVTPVRAHPEQQAAQQRRTDQHGDAPRQQHGRGRSSEFPLDSAEQVALAPHRLDLARLAGAVVELAPQLGDGHVHRAVGAVELDAAQLLQDAVAAEHAAGIARQHHQQVELAAGQLHRLVAPQHGAFGQVDAQPADHDQVALEMRLVDAAAPQQGPHPRQQHARLARLADVVVGAHLQAQHLVVAVVAGGEHEDRQQQRFGAQLPAHLQAVQ
uniref:Secreted protein n=1 Tax=Steinernema glaseri TaxID=37863 RepID=A0A1I7YW33_9BILA